MITEKQKQFMSVVLYMYNNEEEVKAFLPLITKTMTDNFEHFEIICVDDKSKDKCVKFVRDFVDTMDERQNTTILEMSSHQGLEMSMNAGVDLAIGDLIFEFDNIGNNYTPGLIMDAYQKAISGFDVVSVVPKKVKGFISKAFYHLYNWGLNNHENPITHEDFRIVSRRALNRIKAVNHYIPYRKALYSQCGLPASKITYSASKHIQKESVNNRINLALETLILFTNTIQKLSLFICLLFAAITIGVGIYIVYVYFGVNRPVEGWTPMMGFLTLGFFGLFLLFSLIFKYLSVILNTIFIKQWYSIKSIEKL
jgi:dolichol-phosphate mannosyltransferase